MIFYVENETEYDISNDDKKLFETVIMETAKSEHFDFDFEVNLLFTDNTGIQYYNREFRKIDKETDVLSFPNLNFLHPADYSCLEDVNSRFQYVDPETSVVAIGDIIISYEKALEQAFQYGHSKKREICFLIVHSMLHLLGYDHLEPTEMKIMEEKQEKILFDLHITKD